MAKVTFELEFVAQTLVGAKSIAEEKISKFLGVPSEEVAEIVDVELKGKTFKEEDGYTILVYGSVKRNTAITL